MVGSTLPMVSPPCTLTLGTLYLISDKLVSPTTVVTSPNSTRTEILALVTVRFMTLALF